MSGEEHVADLKDVPALEEAEPIKTAEERENSRSWGYFEEKAECGFVGLSNQGATCYMNSLLQTLYMTPEFREALYKWEYDEKKESPHENCIPFQLQKLFGHLQLSNRSAVGTKGLTRSFGWDASDSFEQHDIQELNRVLFDALEQSFRGTPQESLVNDLYEGTLVDQIICQECKNVIARDDKFLDVPVVIRNVETLHAALDLFVEPEILDGDNKYQCDKCNKKCDALKGLQFKHLPYLLTIQLKRFDIDFELMERVKINSKLEFPRYLDMTEYIEPEQQKRKLYEFVQELKKKLHADDDDMIADGENSFLQGESKSNTASDDDDEDYEMQDEPEVEDLEPVDDTSPPTGDNVYELYSILIHSGSADHGHYYAYIKSFKDMKWYNFDDSTVTPLKRGEIESTFGDGKNNFFRGSSNAYMLVYRKVDAAKNLKDAGKDVPSALAQQLELRNQEYEEEKKIHKEKADKLSIRILVNPEETPHTLLTKRSNTLRQVINEVYEKYSEVQKLAESSEDIRFRLIDMRKIPGNDYYGKEHKTLESLSVHSNATFLIESRKPGTPWRKWSPTEMSLQVFEWREALQSNPNISPDFLILLDQSSTLGELRRLIVEETNGKYQLDTLRIYQMEHKLEELQGDDRRVRPEFRLFNGDKIYIEKCSPDDVDTPLVVWYRRTKDQITLRYNLLGEKEFTQTIQIDRNSTLLELKEKIGEKLNIQPSSFKVQQQYTVYSEWKDVSKTLVQLNLTDNRAIHILKGIPLSPTQYNVICMFYPLSGLPENAETFPVAIDQTWTMQELREKLAAKLGISADLMRLRDHYNFRLTKIHKGNKIVKESITTLYDGKSLAIEEINEPENLEDDDRLIRVVRYHPGEHRVDEAEQVFIKKDISLADLQSLLAKRGEFAEEFIEIAKPFSTAQINDPDVVRKLKWRSYTTGDKGDMSLDKFSWMPFDADVFVFKNSAEDPEVVPSPIDDNGNKSSSSSTSGVKVMKNAKYSRPERSLKIKVSKEY